MGEIKLKKRYTLTEPDYAEKITEVATELYLEYTDVATPKTESIVSDAYTTDWNEPPDLKVGLMWDQQSVTLDNSWARAGSTYSKTGLNITTLDILSWKVFFKNPLSIRNVKIFNPFGWTTRVKIFGTLADKTTVAGDVNQYSIRSGNSLEIYLVDHIEQEKQNSAVYCCVQFQIFNKAYSDNLLEKSGTTGFVLPFPDADPSNGKAWGPSVALDCYNIIDRYGLFMAGVAGALTGGELAYASLKESSVIAEVAGGLGVGIGEMAGILAIGIYEKWIALSDIFEFILPALALSATPAVAAFAMNRLPSKYQNLAGAGGALAFVGAGASFGLALVMLNMVDDIEMTVEV